MNRLLSFSAIFLLIAALSACTRDSGYYHAEPQPQVFTFTDDFNNNQNNWVFYSQQNNAEASIAGGLLHYTYYPQNPGSNTVAITTGADLAGPWTIETSVRTDNAIALAFGVSPQRYGYSFFIDPTGYFAVYDEGDETHAPIPLIDWTSSSAIHQGWNDLEIRHESGYWYGSANGTQVFSLAEHPLFGDQIGYIILNNTTADADYLQVQSR